MHRLGLVCFLFPLNIHYGFAGFKEFVMWEQQNANMLVLVVVMSWAGCDGMFLLLHVQSATSWRELDSRTFGEHRAGFKILNVLMSWAQRGEQQTSRGAQASQGLTQTYSLQNLWSNLLFCLGAKLGFWLKATFFMRASAFHAVS